MSDEACYLLVKRDLYYRPNSYGYTGIRDHAGRYTKADAESHADLISGVTMVHVDEAPLIARGCFDDIAVKYLTERLEASEQALADMKAERALDRAALMALVEDAKRVGVDDGLADQIDAEVYASAVARLSKGEGE